MSDSLKGPAEGVTAAEHALRLLTGEDQQEATRRAVSEPGFAAEIARWRGRLAVLYDEIEPVAAPPDLWTQIEARTTGRSAANDNVSALRRRLVAWKAAAGAMTALAAALALFVLVEPRTTVVPQPQIPAAQRPSAPMVAILADSGRNKAVASWDPGARQLVLAVTGDMPVGSQHSPELWVIPAGGKPRSLGLMPEGKQAHLRLADAVAQLLAEGATIAVSVEPRGGSPTGAPTGPVIASGALVQA
jgi:anti-sigma-K factor RskA